MNKSFATDYKAEERRLNSIGEEIACKEKFRQSTGSSSASVASL
jgi:hypothetical protein